MQFISPHQGVLTTDLLDFLATCPYWLSNLANPLNNIQLRLGRIPILFSQIWFPYFTYVYVDIAFSRWGIATKVYKLV